MATREPMRTVAVFIGAVLLSFVFRAALSHVLTPNAGHLIAQMLTTPQTSPEWNEIWRQWHRFNMVSLFVVAPLTGVVVGVFVGLLQRAHAVLVAGASQLPNFVFLWLSDGAKTWAMSASGILSFVVERALPFITAMLMAWMCYRVIRLRHVRPAESRA